jgi:uncharacterized protein YndB with AHSA1/START domain
MTRIYTSIIIHRPIEEVFAYVTTPGNWPAWHPSSLGVSGATDHPLANGETATEDFVVAGRRGHVTWTARNVESPRHWTIVGNPDGGGTSTIGYVLTPRVDGTVFERELDYAMPNAFLALLDRVILHRRVQTESVQAVSQLKSVLESNPAAAVLTYRKEPAHVSS